LYNIFSYLYYTNYFPSPLLTLEHGILNMESYIYGSNSISKKAKKIISSGIAGDDDDFMAETASNPALKQTQSQHPGRLELSSDGDNSSADGGMSAVDRMTQALAARAAAGKSESESKIEGSISLYCWHLV
tara:strand:- start:312 stop:704 length:393 start_codon:yes stop_codon:yes gene_type:complete